jgi:hypothetical protein
MPKASPFLPISSPAARTARRFACLERPSVDCPIQNVATGWSRLVAKHPLVPKNAQSRPSYLLKLRVQGHHDAEKDTDRLILDLMWTAGAHASEVLALAPVSFVGDGYDFGVKVERMGACRSISPRIPSNTHSIRLPLHGRPLKYSSQLFGQRSVDSNKIYTRIDRGWSEFSLNSSLYEAVFPSAGEMAPV